MEIYWGPGCQMYVSRGWRRRDLRGADHARSARAFAIAHWLTFPNWRAGSKALRSSASERGAVTVTRSLRQVYRERTVLIGDASGFRGRHHRRRHGPGFSAGLALADALVADNLEQYQNAHRRMARRPAFMAQLMLMLDRFPRVRPRVLRTCCREARHIRAPVGRARLRMSPDQAFMREALGLARQAEANGEVPVGAVVVVDGEIVGAASIRPSRNPIPRPTPKFSRCAKQARTCATTVWKAPRSTLRWNLA